MCLLVRHSILPVRRTPPLSAKKKKNQVKSYFAGIKMIIWRTFLNHPHFMIGLDKMKESQEPEKSMINDVVTICKHLLVKPATSADG